MGLFCAALACAAAVADDEVLSEELLLFLADNEAQLASSEELWWILGNWGATSEALGADREAADE